MSNTPVFLVLSPFEGNPLSGSEYQQGDLFTASKSQACEKEAISIHNIVPTSFVFPTTGALSMASSKGLLPIYLPQQTTPSLHIYG